MITSAGSILINAQLPEDLQDHQRIINKKELKKLLKDVGYKDPLSYGTTTKRLKDMGDQQAYLDGCSFKWSDLAPIDTSHVFKKYQGQLNKSSQIPNEVERLDATRQINMKIEGELNDITNEHIKKGQGFTKWVELGVKGNPNNIRQMLVASGNQVDLREQVYPHMSKNSYSKGLNPSDYFVSALGARKGIVNSFISVRDPGAFAKELYTLTNEMVITDHDCGTLKGKSYHIPQEQALAIDRLLLEPAGNQKRNDLVTASSIDHLVKMGVKEIKVRSPLYCQAPQGVCSMCVGLLEDGRMAPIGDTVGLRSAQSMTEKLTQMALSTKHTGGVVGKKSPFEKLKQLMHVPENFSGGAVLSQHEGQISSINKLADGGHHIMVGDFAHYIQPNQEIQVKKGQTIGKGDSLTDGLINPKELVDLKGMDAAREYLANEMRLTYEQSGNVGHPKVFETVVRGILNLGEVVDPGDHPHMPGEIVKWNSVQALTRPQVFSGPPSACLGYRLFEDVPQIGAKKNDMVDNKVLDECRKKGIQLLKVWQRPMKVNPIMMGTERAALIKNDVLSNLGFRFLKDQLRENIALGRSSNLHSYDPIPAYAYGAEFGQGEQGRY